MRYSFWRSIEYPRVIPRSLLSFAKLLCTAIAATSMSTCRLPSQFSIAISGYLKQRRLHYCLVELFKRQYSTKRKSSWVDGPDLSFFTGLSTPIADDVTARAADLPYLDKSSWDGGLRKGMAYFMVVVILLLYYSLLLLTCFSLL